MKKTAYRPMAALGICLSSLLCIHLTGSDAVASETAGGWRPIYDLVLRWLNFLVLVFLIVKFGGPVIKKFFASQKSDVAQQLERIEAEKKKADEKIAEIQLALEENDRRLAGIRDRIVKQGEKKREQVVADAHRRSAAMLEELARKVERMAIEAKESLRAELIDAAVSIVEERLPKLLTERDNQDSIDSFVSSITSK